MACSQILTRVTNPNNSRFKQGTIALKSSNGKQRAVVEKAVREVCLHRKYQLRAINVRTNHAHTVVSALSEPEPILDAFKAYSTRALRRTGLLDVRIKPWARHGSTIYLWKERDVEKAVEYVLLGQGGDLPPFE